MGEGSPGLLDQEHLSPSVTGTGLTYSKALVEGDGVEKKVAMKTDVYRVCAPLSSFHRPWTIRQRLLTVRITAGLGMNGRG